MKTLIKTLALSVSLALFPGLPVLAGDTDIPKDMLKDIDAMKRLPADGFHVVEAKGHLMLMSTNGHYVMAGGRLFDLWNQTEVRKVADVEATTHIPMQKMGLKTEMLGGLIVGRGEKPAVTVFLDPASEQSRKLLPELRTLAAGKRVDLVFVPAQSSRSGVSRALICDRSAAQAFFEKGRLPNPLSDSERCGLEKLQKAQVMIQLLNIRILPFSIAANGATAAGIPRDYGAFVAGNLESKS